MGRSLVVARGGVATPLSSRLYGGTTQPFNPTKRLAREPNGKMMVSLLTGLVRPADNHHSLCSIPNISRCTIIFFTFIGLDSHDKLLIY